MTAKLTRDLETRSGEPLGARWDGQATTFTVVSERAEQVELCLVSGAMVERRLPMDRDGDLWSVTVPDARPGQHYGFRAHGPWEPESGDLFNPAKLLTDPYARAIDGGPDWRRPLFGFRRTHRSESHAIDRRDSLGGTPLSVVVEGGFDWGDDRPPRVPMTRTVIYEAHVRGLTTQMPQVPEALRGTYAGLAHPAVIEHLLRLGVTSVELLPIHAFIDDEFLVNRGLRNYWGYNTLGFFAPEARYAAAKTAEERVREFKSMVRSLHEAGLEVLLDVVCNHTCEGGSSGPTLCFRGLDNRLYYRLDPDDPSQCEDLTGTGNTLNFGHPRVRQLALDSLRYWVEEMHVDGFRFDLATTLGRTGHGFDPESPFFQAVSADPVIARAKLIAEPWDVGPGGYQPGNFPSGWCEWNDAFRITVRSFWRGDHGHLGDIGQVVAGSAHRYAGNGRSPLASINYVTAHDGFTLRDLVSFENKHNIPNGENNRDGADWNQSANYGVEGLDAPPEIEAVRDRQRFNQLASLFLSAGVPMLLAGDEIARTQRGNNNAYCQDNEVSWLDWSLDERAEQTMAYVRRLIAFRDHHPALLRTEFLSGLDLPHAGTPDISWFRPNGQLMTDEDWHDPEPHMLAYRLVCHDCDDVVFVAMNASEEPVLFQLPESLPGDWSGWVPGIWTEHPNGEGAGMEIMHGAFTLGPRSLAALSLELASHLVTDAGEPLAD